MIDRSVLACAAPFRDIGSDALDILVRGAVAVEKPRGAVLWTAGSPARGLYLLTRGSVRAVRGRDGRQTVVHRSGPGSLLGEVPLFDGEGYPATVVAETDVELACIERPTLEAAMAADPDIAWRLLRALGNRVRELASRIDRLAHRDVEERLRVHLRARRRQAGGGAFTLGMTQAELAEDLGTVREVVARALRRLVDRGELERVGRGRYRLPPGLER